MRDALQALLGLAIVIGCLALVALIQGPPIQSPEAVCSKHPGWTAEQCERISAHELWIGMTEAMAMESQGRPDDINKMVTAAGTHEQWIYRTEILDSVTTYYLYFENGLLTAWQE